MTEKVLMKTKFDRELSVDLPHAEDFLNFDPEVGPLGALVSGEFGSGKTDFVNLLTDDALAVGWCCIYRGDRFCEWKDLIINNWAVKLVVPKTPKINYLGEWWEKDSKGYPLKNFKKYPLEIINYESPEQVVSLIEPQRIVVVFDAHLRGEPKTRLWQQIGEKLLNRTNLPETPILWVDHEISLTVPQGAKGDQWKAVDDLSNDFIEYRKGFICPLWVCHLETEVFWRVYGKLPFNFYKIPIPTSHTHKAIAKGLLNAKIYNISIQKGAKAAVNIPVERFNYFRERFGLLRMVPTEILNSDSAKQFHSQEREGRDNGDEVENPRLVCTTCGHDWIPRIWNPSREEKPRKCPNCCVLLKWGRKS